MKILKKCIFLVVHQGFEARYLLRTDIFKEIKKHVEKIVIVTPNADEDYFKQEFQKNNVYVERFKNKKCEEFLKKSKVQKVGSFGDVSCFSFFPSKNPGAHGDGGMVVTNNDQIAKKIKMLRVHGSKDKYFHLMEGRNSRLDEIQAGILRIKLKYLNMWNEQRRKIAPWTFILSCSVGKVDTLLMVSRATEKHRNGNAGDI